MDKGTPAGDEHLKSRQYAWQTLLNSFVALSLLVATHFAIARGLIQPQFKISILKIMAITAGVAFAIAYFAWDHDILIWNCRVMTGPDKYEVVPTSERPVWQKGIAGMFIIVSTACMVHASLAWLTRVNPQSGG